MTTATKKPEKKDMTEKKKAAPEVKVTPEQHLEVVKSFTSECLSVEFIKTKGLPTSKQTSAKAIAEEAEGDESSFSASKKLFTCDHPILDKVNKWASQVTKWRDTYTFPMAAASVDARTVRKAKAKRLIRKEDVEEFENGMDQLAEEGLELSKQLHAAYDQIMSLEKKKLGNKFNSSDYPAKDHIYSEYDKEVVDPETKKAETVRLRAGALRIGGRDYSEVSAPVELPKKVLGRMIDQTYEKLNASVEVVVADLAKVMTLSFSTLAGNLVDRVRIRPPFGNEVYQAVGAEAEVVEVLRNADDPNVPEGHVTIKVKYKEAVAGEKRKKDSFQDFGPMTEAQFQALRPSPMDETKIIKKSVVETFGTYLDTFVNLKSKLGAYGEHVDKALDVLRELHHNALQGRKSKAGAEAVIDTIKYSPKFRHDLKEALDGTCEILAAVAQEAGNVRRKVHGNVAQQIAKKVAGKKG
jgi:hypothetical protein